MQREFRQRLLICLLLTVATLLVYAPAARFDFINYDDSKLVTGNAHVRAGFSAENVAWAFTTTTVEYWHPVTWLSHMLDCQLFGLDAGAHHAVNVIIHVLNSLLLFLVFSNMTGRTWPSAFVAALFALHPLHIESVAWIAERKDVLSTLFWMLALWAYARYAARPSPGSYALVACFFALGLMSKPMVVTLPVVLLLLDFWPLGRPWSMRLIGEKLPLLGLSLLSTVVTFVGARQTGQVATVEGLPMQFRINNAIASYLRYIAKMFWPDDLAMYYPFHASPPAWIVIGSVAVLALVTGVAFLVAGRRPYVLVGWGWYLVTLSPVIMMMHGASPIMADRYTMSRSSGFSSSSLGGWPTCARNGSARTSRRRQWRRR